MTAHILTTSSFAAIMALSSFPAFANVTAEDVWQNWQTLGAGYGQTLTAGAQSRSGDTLTLSNLTIAVTEEDRSLNGTIPQVSFRETGDGRVEITMSDAYALNVQGKAPDGTSLSNTIDISQTGLVMFASGTPEAISYDMAAEAVTVHASDFKAGDKSRDMDVKFDLSQFAAVYATTAGDVTGVNSTFSAQKLAFRVDGKQEDERKGTVDLQGQMNNIAGASAGAMPKGLAKGSFAAMLSQGFSTDGSFTYDSGSFTLATTDEQGSTMNLASNSKGGALNVSVDKERVAYGLSAKGVQWQASGSSIPFPEVTAAYDEAAVSLLMPVAKGDEAKDFALLTRLKGLTVSDMIWGMIDPGATLPRDPATLVIDLKGKAKPLVDFLTADRMAMMDSTAPFALEALDVNALQLTIAGAELLGDGALAFDNSKPPVLGGVAPMPTGKLNLSLTGANTLLGKLQTLGLVDPQITMTFGMMAGMLAKPGPAPDSLIAEIEFTPEGRILSNGNPLPF